jgi:tripartite ATP-independent transporter DctP family solute receptor
MKKVISLVLVLAMMATVLVGCGEKQAPTDNAGSETPATPEKAIEIKIATVGNEDHQSTIAAQLFKDEVEKVSNGKVTATIFPNGSLGGEREAAEGVKLGTIQMTVVTSDGALPAWVPDIQVLSIPYLFANKEEAYDILDNTLQQELAPQFEAQGFKHLGFVELGFRHFTNNVKEVKSAADMQGLSIRVQEAPIWFALIEKLGATATPVPFNELYTALQQGMVDGQENPITSIATSKFNEVQKYLTLDGHTYAAESIIMNKDYYDGLSDEVKGYIDAAVAVAIPGQREAVSAKEEEYLQQLKDSGMVVTEADLDSFVKATEGLYKLDEVKKLVDSSLVELIMSKLGK